jgi:hypothetical protein
MMQWEKLVMIQWRSQVKGGGNAWHDGMVLLGKGAVWAIYKKEVRGEQESDLINFD